MLVLIIPTVCAVQIEYSTDNATWENVTYLNETTNESYQINLHEGTLYYFRGRYNDTESWVYTNVTTSVSQEEDFMDIAIIIALSFVAGLFLYFGFKLEENHFVLKIILMFFSLITIILIPAALINGTTATAPTFLKIVLAFFGIFVIYFSVYMIYHWLKKSEVLFNRR